MNDSSASSDPQKTEEAVDHCQNNSYVKAVGASPVRSNLCTQLTSVSTAVRISHRDIVRSTAVEEQQKQFQ